MRSMTDDVVVLPLFPLHLVLFPGQILPLHIFEPRYRLMVNRCIEQRRPFGVVLLREDTLDWRDYQNDVALPHEVGTTAHIRQVEQLPDGRLNIITVGMHRFRVRKLRFDQPFLQGEVESFPLAQAEDDISAHREISSVRRLLRSYMEILAQVTDIEAGLDEIPSDPRTLAFLTASILQIPWDDKQALLDVPEVSSLLESERLLLRREGMLLRFMQATEARLEERIAGPTGYLYPN